MDRVFHAGSKHYWDSNSPVTLHIEKLPWSEIPFIWVEADLWGINDDDGDYYDM